MDTSSPPFHIHPPEDRCKTSRALRGFVVSGDGCDSGRRQLGMKIEDVNMQDTPPKG